MYRSNPAATSSVINLNERPEMRERSKALPRGLTIASKIERLLEYEVERVSPIVTSAAYSDIFSSSSTQASPIDGFNAFSPTDEIGPISLPPPPRKSARRKRTSAYYKAHANASEPYLPSPSTTGSGDGVQHATTSQDVLNKVASVPTLAAIGEATDSSSLLTVRREIKPEPSFEELVAEKKFFASERPRIISAVSIPPISIPTSPSSTERLPVDDRESLPPTPVATELLDAPASASARDINKIDDSTKENPETPQEREAAPSRSPTIATQYATLPWKIDKSRAAKKNPFLAFSETSSPTLSAAERPTAASGAGDLSTKAKESVKARNKLQNRGKLQKPSRVPIPSPEMRQIRAQDAIFRDGFADIVPADHPWRRRPLLSHAKSASRSSGGSMDSDSTYSPPSTIDPGPEPRISISSTIYPEELAQDSDRTSFIDIRTPYSPSFPVYDDQYQPLPVHNILQEIQSEQVIDPDNYQLMSILSGSAISKPRSHGSSPKPPVPTTPKPMFMRKPLSPNSSPSQSPIPASLVFEGYQLSEDVLPPPTTNWLGQEERADLIRKSRKLARVFGRTPGPEVMAYQDCSRLAQTLSSKHRHQRTPLSFSNDLDNTGLRRRRASAWPSPTESHFSSSTGRRHSLPLSPDDISFLSATSPLYEASLSQVASQLRDNYSGHEQMMISVPNDHQDGPSTTSMPHHETDGNPSPSRTSFIDLSEEEGLELEDTNSIISQSTRKMGGTRRPTSPSAQSFFENMTPEEQAEEGRRRKREKLAKLHRFLGSQVPANLVLGTSDHETTLPPPVPSLRGSSKASSSDTEDMSRKAWLRRRRSSSAAALPSRTSDLERVKEDLDNKEKAINVRRAQKMEKVFGVAPPQTLYHTRHSPSPSLPFVTPPIAAKTLGNPSAFIPAPDPVYFTKNPNQSAYQKPKQKKNARPGTAESSKQLLPKGGRRSSNGFEDSGGAQMDSYNNRTSYNGGSLGGSYNGASFVEGPLNSGDMYNPGPFNGGGSLIYNHYHHSLNSLNDILDRDDRESLVELHNYLNGDDPADIPATAVVLEDFIANGNSVRGRRTSDASVRTERRLSLPARTSTTSLVSEHSIISSPKPEITDFQLRRRRAAKLAQFFGVQYRDLINDVLDSLENGLEHEWKRGTLQANEIEDLLLKLRQLKVKREGLF